MHSPIPLAYRYAVRRCCSKDLDANFASDRWSGVRLIFNGGDTFLYDGVRVPDSSFVYLLNTTVIAWVNMRRLTDDGRWEPVTQLDDYLSIPSFRL